MNLKELHEAATPAPWTLNTGWERIVIEGDEWAITEMCRFITGDEDGSGNAALIVALRNAYANGELIERENVDALIEAGCRMEHILSHSAGANDVVRAWREAYRAVIEAQR